MDLTKNYKNLNSPETLYLHIQRDRTGLRALGYTFTDKMDQSLFFFHQAEHSDRIFMRSQKTGGDKSKFCSWNNAVLI